MARRVPIDYLLGDLLQVMRSHTYSFEHLRNVDRGGGQERNLSAPFRDGQQRKQTGHAKGSIIDGVKLVEHDMVEATHIEKRVDRGRARYADTGDHFCHHFWYGEDDATNHRCAAVQELPYPGSSKARVPVAGLVARPFDDPVADPRANLDVIQAAPAKFVRSLLAGILFEVLQQALGRNDE